MEHQQELPGMESQLMPTATDYQAGPPPCRGWWKTKKTREAHRPAWGHRYWDGKNWSVLVLESYSDAEALQAQYLPSTTPPDEVLWSGLTAPHPAGYSADHWEEIATDFKTAGIVTSAFQGGAA